MYVCKTYLCSVHLSQTPFRQSHTRHMPANGQPMRNRASAKLESSLYTGNIDPSSGVDGLTLEDE